MHAGYLFVTDTELFVQYKLKGQYGDVYGVNSLVRYDVEGDNVDVAGELGYTLYGTTRNMAQHLKIDGMTNDIALRVSKQRTMGILILKGFEFRNYLLSIYIASN